MVKKDKTQQNTPANDTVKLTSKRGGKRSGSGRPVGSGKYGEPTKAIRVPEGSITHINHFLKNHYKNKPDNSDVEQTVQHGNVSVLGIAGHFAAEDTNTHIPVYSSKVAAGFPSPADDHVESAIDLNDYLIEKPGTTFMLRVEGESMKDAGILPDDILIVDRSKKAIHNKIVIAAVDGELTVKRLYHRGNTVKLLPENPDYPEILIKREADLVIWGVVIGSFRRFQQHSFL